MSSMLPWLAMTSWSTTKECYSSVTTSWAADLDHRDHIDGTREPMTLASRTEVNCVGIIDLEGRQT